MHHPPPFAPLPPYPYGPPYGATPYMPPTIDNTATYAPPPLPPQANPGVNPTDGQNVMAGAIPPPPLSEIPTDSMVDSESPEKPSSGQPLYQPAGEYNQTGQPRDHNANTDYPYGTSSGGAGAATNPSPVPVTYHNYGVNSYMPPPPYNAGPSRDMNNGGNFSKKPRLGQSSNQLPENERCTLRCTGIPTYVKEEDLKVHFEAFGHVVELQLSPMATNDQHDKGDGDGGSEKKRTYNECLVQFFSAQNAKKCFTSPSPVLNNRFIHLHMSKFNIIPPCDVEVPSQEIIERDHLLLSQDVVPQAVAVKKKPQTIIKPATTKWKRSDAAAAKPTSQEGEASVEPSSSSIADGVNPVIETPKKETEISKEGIALKQNFEQLKALKQQAEESLKKKETVLQVIKLFISLTMHVKLIFSCLLLLLYTF
jgi:RNA recognition motif-containing protein